MSEKTHEIVNISLLKSSISSFLLAVSKPEGLIAYSISFICEFSIMFCGKLKAFFFVSVTESNNIVYCCSWMLMTIHLAQLQSTVFLHIRIIISDLFLFFPTDYKWRMMQY